MFPEERQALIIREVQKHGSVSVAELAREFQVSGVTIRNDLRAISAEGWIHRTHGGAMSVATRLGSVIWEHRTQERAMEKDAIGKAAAALLKTDETIILDAGTTAIRLAAHLGEVDRLTCIVVDLAVAATASMWRNVNVVLTGGYTRGELQLWGPDCLRTIHAHAPVTRAFVGLSGVSLEDGLMQGFAPAVEVKRALIEAAREVIVLADSSKIGATAANWVAPLSVVNKLVTGCNAPESTITALRKMGIEVILV